MGRYYPQIDVCQSEKDGDIAAKKKELELAAEEDFGNSRVSISYFSSLFALGLIQIFPSLASGALGHGTLLNTHGPASVPTIYLQKITSHRLAQFVAFFSLSMVLVSTITFVLATIEELQEDEEGQSDYPIIVAIIHLIDNFVIIFFTIEYILRLLICPVKKKFVKDTMNMVPFIIIKSL